MNESEITFFDILSETWDDNEVLSVPAKIREFLSYLDIKKGMSILDLGTGTGVLLPFLSDSVGPEGQVTGVDISPGMLNQAIQKFKHLKNVQFLKLDFEAEKIDGKFDYIFLYCVYPHLHKPKETLAKLLSDNIRDNGKIIIAFPSDERYINNIHKEKKAESDLLPPANILASQFEQWGYISNVLAYDSGIYIVELYK